jgi:hypothetical protein
MTLEQIQSMTLDNSFAEIMGVWVLTNAPEGNPGSYVYRVLGERDASGDAYDRMEMADGFERPTRKALVDILDARKAELVAIEEARLAEVARVAAIRARWSAIADIRGAMNRAGISTSNPATELERIIKDDDVLTLELLEESADLWDAQVASRLAIDSDIERGRRIQVVCDRVYQYILGFNRRRGLSSQKGDLMEMRFRDALSALKNGRADKAYGLIQGVDVDGDLTTDEMKRNALGILADAANV